MKQNGSPITEPVRKGNNEALEEKDTTLLYKLHKPGCPCKVCACTFGLTHGVSFADSTRVEDTIMVNLTMKQVRSFTNCKSQQEYN